MAASNYEYRERLIQNARAVSAQNESSIGGRFARSKPQSRQPVQEQTAKTGKINVFRLQLSICTILFLLFLFITFTDVKVGSYGSQEIINMVTGEITGEDISDYVRSVFSSFDE